MVKYRTLNGTFSALSDPTRRRIMLELQRGEISVSELAEPFHMSLPAISKHLNVLEEAGLLFRRKEGRTVYCRLATAPLREVDSWLARFRNPRKHVTN